MTFRLSLWVTALALAVAGLGFTAGPAAAAGGYCAGSGINVVVDFGAIGGGVAKACGQASYARQAFTSAGFSLENNPRIGNDFVCTINGAPSNHECAGTGGQGYWALFWARPGGSWVYATTGVSSQPVSSHQTVAFAWQTPSDMSANGHRNPSIAPAAAAKPTAPKSTPATTTHTTTKVGTATSAKSSAAPTPTTSGSPSATAAPSKSAAPSATPTPTASTPTASTPTATTPPTATQPSSKHGGGLPWWIPVAVVVALVIGAAATWWRKRAGG